MQSRDLPGLEEDDAWGKFDQELGRPYRPKTEKGGREPKKKWRNDETVLGEQAVEINNYRKVWEGVGGARSSEEGG